MTEIFDLFFYALKTIYQVLSEKFILNVYGFSFSLWDFLLTIFILSALVPLVSHNIGGSGVSDLVGHVFQSQSERIRNERDLAYQRSQERINAYQTKYNSTRDLFIEYYLRSRYVHHDFANKRGLSNRGNIIYGTKKDD